MSAPISVRLVVIYTFAHTLPCKHCLSSWGNLLLIHNELPRTYVPVNAPGPNEAVFSLPHLGPEGLTVVDAEHIAVVNDNNFPYSSGHTIGKPDDNEITLLNIKALVDAR